MTMREWLTCADPATMLRVNSWSLLDERSQAALAVVEATADGETSARGTTPWLVHHFKTSGKYPHSEPQLEDLAYAGIKEAARQWWLLGRRSPFNHDHPEGKNALYSAMAHATSGTT